jgi:hypothetical protein
VQFGSADDDDDEMRTVMRRQWSRHHRQRAIVAPWRRWPCQLKKESSAAEGKQQ